MASDGGGKGDRDLGVDYEAPLPPHVPNAGSQEPHQAPVKLSVSSTLRRAVRLKICTRRRSNVSYPQIQDFFTLIAG